MAKQLEKIFNECLELINQGESIESCLQRYPEEAAELELLLITFVNVKWRASNVQPRQEFKLKARAQLFNPRHIHYHAKEIKPARQLGIFNLQRMFVPALASILVFVLVGGSVSTVAASASALPSEPLYPIKLASEQVRIAFAFSDSDKAMVNVELAETRSNEIVSMVTQGKTEQITITSERMVKNLDEAERALLSIAQVESIKTPTTASQFAPPSAPKTVTTPTTVPTPPSAAPSLLDNKGASSGESKATEKTRTTEPTAPATVDTSKTSQSQSSQLKQSVQTIINKNVSVLQNSLNTAPQNAITAIQKAIDASKTSHENISNININNKYQDDHKSDDSSKTSDLPRQNSTSNVSSPNATQPNVKPPVTNNGENNNNHNGSNSSNTLSPNNQTNNNTDNKTNPAVSTNNQTTIKPGTTIPTVIPSTVLPTNNQTTTIPSNNQTRSTDQH
jgi:hypothetical protein